MSLVHIYPLHDMRAHVTVVGGCWCEPRIEDCGVDVDGNPARMFVHTDHEDRRASIGKSEKRK